MLWELLGTDCRMTHLLRCCCHGYAQNVLSCRSCTHLRQSAQNTRWGSTCASNGSARSCAARCSAFRLRDSLPAALGADGGSGSGAAEGGCGEEDVGVDPSGLGGGRSFSFSLAVRDVEGGRAEANES